MAEHWRSDMSIKPPSWIERPRADARMMFTTGKQLWRTARDLQEQAEAMPDARTPIIDSSRCWGYVVSAIFLRPLAVEYLLKGLSLQTAGGYLKTHDLLKLFESLDPEMQSTIASEQLPTEELGVPGFLENHRNTFEDWRYPVEGVSTEPSVAGFDRVLAALVKVCRLGSP